jgi:hypothetical protein
MLRSLLAFQGRRQSPICTSSTSDPSGSGLLQGQQKPAEIRAVPPVLCHSARTASISNGESAIRTSKRPSPAQIDG